MLYINVKVIFVIWTSWAQSLYSLPGCFLRLLGRRSFLYTLHIVDGNKMRNYISLRTGTWYLS